MERMTGGLMREAIDLRFKFLHPILEPLLTVKRPFSEQERLSDAARY